MTRASRRAKQAARELLMGLSSSAELLESGNVGDGWIFEFTANDGKEYHVEVCCSSLSDEELREEDQ